MKWSRVAAVGVAAFVAIAFILTVIWTMQRRLIYFPLTDEADPGEYGAEVEAVSFSTDDGLDLAAWWFAAPAPPSAATVLVFSGNAGHRGYRVPLAEALRERGLDVLLVDYRGYGGNPGVPSERGLVADSRAARAYLARRAGVDLSRLVYFGESLGSAVAISLASEHPPATLILRSPFTSMSDIGAHHYPFLPVRLLLRDRFASIDRISQVRCPVLVIAGDRDRIVPLAYSRRLYDAAQGPKALTVIRGADHNDNELLAGGQMIEAMIEFLNRQLKTRT